MLEKNVSIGGHNVKMNLDLSDEFGTKEAVQEMFSEQLGSGHDGVNLIIDKEGNAIIEFIAYIGGPSWTAFITQ